MAPLTIEKFYAQPIDLVWAAITNKEKLKQWYFQLDDFRPETGFIFRFIVSDAAREYRHVCRILEIDPPHLLVHTWTHEGINATSTVTWELAAVENGTRLKLTHKGIENFPQDDPSFRRESFKQGWTELLKSLDQYL